MAKQTYSSRKNFKQDDIEEVKNSSAEDIDNILDFGTVETWERPIVSEKARLRPYITWVVMGLWVVGTTIGLIRFITMGDISILVYSPVVLMVPLKVILDFYYKKE